MLQKIPRIKFTPEERKHNARMASRIFRQKLKEKRYSSFQTYVPDPIRHIVIETVQKMIARYESQHKG